MCQQHRFSSLLSTLDTEKARESAAAKRLELLRAVHIRRVVKLMGAHPLPPDLRQLAPWFVQISVVFGVCLYTAVSEPAVYTMAA